MSNELLIPPVERIKEILKCCEKDEVNLIMEYRTVSGLCLWGSIREVYDLLDGLVEIKPEMAQTLENLTETPKDFWIKLQENYNKEKKEEDKGD